MTKRKSGGRRPALRAGLLVLSLVLLWPAAADARTCPRDCPTTTTTTTAPPATTTTTVPTTTTTTTTVPTTTTTEPPATTTTLPPTTSPPPTNPPPTNPPTTAAPTPGATQPSNTTSTTAEATTTTVFGPQPLVAAPAWAVPTLNPRATPGADAPEKSTSPTVPRDLELTQAFVPARGLSLGDLLLLTAGALAGFWLIVTEVIESGTHQGRLARVHRRGVGSPLDRVRARIDRFGQTK